eukprot:Clim_evm39s144 gene=Clim_evmTU39s144
MSASQQQTLPELLQELGIEDSSVPDRRSGNILDELQRIEAIVEEIQGDRQAIIDLEIQKNLAREALGQIRRGRAVSDHEGAADNPLWFHFGDFFAEVPRDFVKKQLENEYNVLDQKVQSHRKQLRALVRKVREMEGEKSLAALGYGLTAMTMDEVNGVVKEAQVLLETD